MSRFGSALGGLLLAAALCSGAYAQFGPQVPPSSGPKLAAPTAFPAPGSFPTTESVTLMSAEPGAEIHYTWDGSYPTVNSPRYDPLDVLFIAGIYEGDHGLKSGYTLRAIAAKDGHTTSEPSTFLYQVDRRDRTAYVFEQIHPGLRMIRDSDNDKMFLIDGAKTDALIDSGQGRGDLRTYLSRFTGGKPLTVIFTHSHTDHIGQGDNLIPRSIEYIDGADRAATIKLFTERGVPQALIDKHLKTATDGEIIDLGDHKLQIYEVPGHTPGSIVILDQARGDLFTGDSFGSNSPTIPDALWMQFTADPVDIYLATVKRAHARLAGRFTHMMTGHNDHPLLGDTYIRNLETALQRLMDQGDAALVPSYRPAGLWQVVQGDRMHDPNWVALNVNRATYLPAPVDRIASLSTLSVEGAKLQPVFDPRVHDYVAVGGGTQVSATPTSTRAARLTIDGQAARPGAPVAVGAGKTAVIEVTAPDGQTQQRYTVRLGAG